MIKIIYKTLCVILCAFWVLGILLFITGAFHRTFIYPIKYKEIIEENCEIYGVERSLIYAIIKTESSFNSNANSSKDAKGLMQITPSTASFIAEKLKIDSFDIYSVDDNVRFGCWYVSYLFMRFSDEHTVISAYNAGEGRVSEWLNNKEYSVDGIRLIKIPYEETKNYVKKVMRNKNGYKRFYNLK